MTMKKAVDRVMRISSCLPSLTGRVCIENCDYEGGRGLISEGVAESVPRL